MSGDFEVVDMTNIIKGFKTASIEKKLICKKKYRLNHSNEIQVYKKKYHKENYDKELVYRKNNPEKIKANRVMYNLRHREKVLVAKAKYHEDHKEQELSYAEQYRIKNREKIRERDRNLYRAPEVRRRRSLKQLYNLSLEEFEQIKEAQDNKCGICRIVFTKVPRVDHDHITGEVRGLLCGSCNIGLGLLKDSVEMLASAIKYLQTDIILQ